MKLSFFSSDFSNSNLRRRHILFKSKFTYRKHLFNFTVILAANQLFLYPPLFLILKRLKNFDELSLFNKKLYEFVNLFKIRNNWSVKLNDLRLILLQNWTSFYGIFISIVKNTIVKNTKTKKKKVKYTNNNRLY